MSLYILNIINHSKKKKKKKKKKYIYIYISQYVVILFHQIHIMKKYNLLQEYGVLIQGTYS